MMGMFYSFGPRMLYGLASTEVKSEIFLIPLLGRLDVGFVRHIAFQALRMAPEDVQRLAMMAMSTS